ncbi:MAG: DUF4364 family protein [Clostridiales bacterium]|nr:DUF4364 family protein [Clostridiales bacterium]
MSDISIAESKIQILYLVDRAPGVSYHLLMSKCMESLYTDFFTFSRSYEELISGNLMDKSQSGAYTGDAVGSTENLTLTDGGRAVLKDLISSLSAPLISHLEEAASEIIRDMAESSVSSATIEPTVEGRFRVVLNYNGDDRPFSATLTVDDEATATKICKKWKESSSKASEELIRLITGG